MTRTQVCQLLGVAPKSLYLWEPEGKVQPPRRDHRGWRTYSEADLRAFLGEDRQSPAPRASGRPLRTRQRWEGSSSP